MHSTDPTTTRTSSPSPHQVCGGVDFVLEAQIVYATSAAIKAQPRAAHNIVCVCVCCALCGWSVPAAIAAQAEATTGYGYVNAPSTAAC